MSVENGSNAQTYFPLEKKNTNFHKSCDKLCLKLYGVPTSTDKHWYCLKCPSMFVELMTCQKYLEVYWSRFQVMRLLCSRFYFIQVNVIIALRIHDAHSESITHFLLYLYLYDLSRTKTENRYVFIIIIIMIFTGS